MIKLGNTSFNGIPKIAVAIKDEVTNETIKSLHVDVLELRVDQYANLDIEYIVNNVRERKDSGPALILTVRNTESEGGKSGISDDKKLEIFQAVTPLVDAIDIELSSPIVSEVIDLAKKNNKLVIVSSHNFTNTPEVSVLEDVLKDAIKKGADIVKVATQANSIEDVNQLMMFTLKHKDSNVITMSLGSVGSISRLTFPSVGSLLTYSYIGQPLAPGQIPLERLQKDLRLYYPKYNQYLIDKFNVLEDA